MAASPLSPSCTGTARYLIGTNQEIGITAKSGGGQSGAYQLSAQQSRVDTAAAPGDSVALPKITLGTDGSNDPGQVGMVMFFRNNTSNAVQVFGVYPDTVNSVATGTGVSVPANKSAMFWSDSYTQSTNVGTWQMNLSA